MCIYGHSTEVINGRVVCPTCKERLTRRHNAAQRINRKQRAASAPRKATNNDERNL